jgi:beta-lactamase regulating signal transducer with metallopeptidase domain
MFGARAAYALWLAPALRAITPPISLPGFPLTAPSVTGAVDYVLTAGAPSARASVSLGSVMLVVWAAGAAIFLAVHIWRHQRFLGEALSSGRPLGIAGIPYDVIASDRVGGPMATGLIHPLILVPADFERRMSAEEQRFALWHEQLHHRRGDIWASAGALILVSLLWPNPFAHLALGAFRRDMEAACDARLLAEAGASAAPAYAATILRCAAAPVPRSLCALTSIDELKGRLTMLKLNHGRGRRLAGLAITAIIAGTGIATAAVVQDQAREETKVIEKKVVIRHAGKDDLKSGEIPKVEELTTNCEGEKFLVDSSGGTETRKENVKFFLCADKGENLLTALEKAEADLQKRDEIPAASKAEILAKIRARISELRSKG